MAHLLEVLQQQLLCDAADARAAVQRRQLLLLICRPGLELLAEALQRAEQDIELVPHTVRCVIFSLCPKYREARSGLRSECSKLE